VPRIGTLPLTVFAACGPPSRNRGATFTHLCRPSVSRRQVLLFPICARDELTPPIRRTPPGPHAGSSLAEGAPRWVLVCPGTCGPPSFGVIKSLSTRQQWFTHVRLLVAYLTRSWRAVSATLTTPALDRRSLRWFGISACTATPEDLPPSQIEHVSFWRSSTSSSLHFQDTPRTRLSDTVHRQACAGFQYRTVPVSR
jgi:hypothetical protein